MILRLLEELVKKARGNFYRKYCNFNETVLKKSILLKDKADQKRNMEKASNLTGNHNQT